METKFYTRRMTTMLHMSIIYQVVKNNKVTPKKHNVHKKNLGIKKLIIETNKSYLFVKASCINLDK